VELIDIPGIGEARKKSFEENDIFSCEDLINFFPYKYYDFSKTTAYADDGIVKLIKATAIENAKVVRIRSNFSFVSCKMNDEFGHTFTAIWYNQTYIKSEIYLGVEMFLYGKNSPTKKNTFVVNISKFADKFQKLGLLPVYHSAGNIGQKVMHDAINYSISNMKFSSFVPNKLLYKYNLIDLKDAYIFIHNPETSDLLEDCYNRIELENLIPMLAINEYNKLTLKENKKQQYQQIDQLLQEFESMIPYKLTTDQKNACHAIENDMKSKFSMNRMIQGDVGSGKTIVAMFGAYVAIKNGYQAVIIAPTEILANQHYETAKKIFASKNISCVCLSGSVKGNQKREILQMIKSGNANLIVGTHALISNDVEFKNMSFAVIDEQHKFGVNQRKLLKNKGITPDILVMSATPIPRTLGLILYGDLDITKITERPKPLNITTNIVIKSKQNDMWEYISKKIETGSKVYVVCSKIDEDNEDESTLAFSAKNMFEYLKSKFDKDLLGLVHGKLSKETQNKTIEKFREGKIKILVSTTIVEVGVDVPDSDIMVIATPERFGLATLHQLRGRIGRNGEEAHCFCLADNLTEKSYERINYFKNHNNGFDIAEFDLKTRGTGSLLGTNQHGEDNGLVAKLLSENYARAREILEAIKSDVSLYTKVLEKGNELSKYNVLEKVILN
jgi:ATP-dependent DNA helicase RecG